MSSSSDSLNSCASVHPDLDDEEFANLTEEEKIFLLTHPDPDDDSAADDGEVVWDEEAAAKSISPEVLAEFAKKVQEEYEAKKAAQARAEEAAAAKAKEEAYESDEDEAMKAYLDQVDDQVAALNRWVDRSSTAQQRECVLARREAEVTRREKEAAAHEQQVKNLIQGLTKKQKFMRDEHDNILRIKSVQQSQRDYLENLQQQLNEEEDELYNKKCAHEDKERQLKKMQRQLEEQSEELRGKEAALDRREAKLAKKDQELDARWHCVKEVEDDTHNKSAHLQQTEVHLSHVHRQLAAWEARLKAEEARLQAVASSTIAMSMKHPDALLVACRTVQIASPAPVVAKRKASEISMVSPQAMDRSQAASQAASHLVDQVARVTSLMSPMARRMTQ